MKPAAEEPALSEAAFPEPDEELDLMATEKLHLGKKQSTLLQPPTEPSQQLLRTAVADHNDFFMVKSVSVEAAKPAVERTHTGKMLPSSPQQNAHSYVAPCKISPLVKSSALFVQGKETVLQFNSEKEQCIMEIRQKENDFWQAPPTPCYANLQHWLGNDFLSLLREGQSQPACL
jgi:hypothetical protein